MAEIFIQQRLYFIVFKNIVVISLMNYFRCKLADEDTKRQVKGKINQIVQKQGRQGEKIPKA